MQTDSAPSASANEQPADDHLLEDLAALTSLFNPVEIWHEEEKLDDLDEKPSQEALHPPVAPAD
ncbi:hypothetical protein [Hymenobacter baengnokdamensis]|uniref:hypothetical protein n=1 Tax=Hymenobacter baengnokdamensis TaxID=2615203 RepID=UPI0012452377|nr:hypothetical protein [Hymenobacter baengnokdamensis]